MNAMRYIVIIEPADDGTFSVYVPDLPGCISSGAMRSNPSAKRSPATYKRCANWANPSPRRDHSRRMSPLSERVIPS